MTREARPRIANLLRAVAAIRFLRVSNTHGLAFPISLNKAKLLQSVLCKQMPGHFFLTHTVHRGELPRRCGEPNFSRAQNFEWLLAIVHLESLR